MEISGFNINLQNDETTDNWSIVDYGNVTMLEVYFENVTGVDIVKIIPNHSTMQDMVEEHDFLVMPKNRLINL